MCGASPVPWRGDDDCQSFAKRGKRRLDNFSFVALCRECKQVILGLFILLLNTASPFLYSSTFISPKVSNLLFIVFYFVFVSAFVLVFFFWFVV